MTTMTSSDPIPTVLAEIAALLRQEGYDEHASDIEALREAALSPDLDR